MTKPKQLPSIERLNKAFVASDGELYWKESKAGTLRGKKAGGLNKLGYRVVRLDGQRYLVHRLLWKLWYNEEPPDVIDHIDGNRNNNKLSNLRASDKSHNALNKQHKGCTKKESGKWAAAIQIDNKKIFLGHFDTEEEASVHYKEFKELYMEMKAC